MIKVSKLVFSIKYKRRIIDFKNCANDDYLKNEGERMTNYSKRIFKLFFGLFLCGLGIVMTMKANMGFSPYDVLHQGIANTFGLTIGTVSILIGLIICIICLFLGEKLGLGTISDMILIGILIDLFLSLNFIPKMNGYLSGLVMITTGLFTIAFGSYLYISSGFCAGPRDNLMIAIKRKTGLAVGFCRGLLEVSAVLCGWLLGGPVGIGTVLSAFGISFCIQIVFSLMKFNPTKIEHETLISTSKLLIHFKS